jgi:DNA-binding transcriptional ArsR family regulator
MAKRGGAKVMSMEATAARGDADMAAIGSALSDRRRAAVLLALLDGRALPATVLAAEAGVAASTASAHLAKLVDAGLVTVEPSGRHRYYRLAGPDVAAMLEAVARVSPPMQVRSLRQGTRAEAMRAGRLCYDHLAGRMGVSLMAGLLDGGLLGGGDGLHSAGGADRLAAPGRELDYLLTEQGRDRRGELGIEVPAGGRRPLVRYCVDWSEQRHHLAGALGAAVAARFVSLGWIRRMRGSRAVKLTDAGRAGLRRELGVSL